MKKKFYEKAWFLVLMAFLVPPIGIALVWLTKEKWNKIIKILVSVILCCWTVIWGVMLFVPADESTPSNTESTTDSTEYVAQTERTTQEETTTAAVVTTEETATVAETTEEPTTTKAPTTAETTTKKVTATKAPTTPEPTTKKVTTTAEPTTKKVTTTVKETTTKKATTTENKNVGQTVYRTKSGECYHYENPCGRGTYYAVSLSEAKAAGLRPCEKCVLH